MQTKTVKQAKNKAAARAELPAGVRLRLTVRGKFVLGFAIAGLVCAPAAATLFDATAGAVANTTQGSVNYGYIVPAAGDTLWSIAERLDSAADPRDVVAELIRFNQLNGSELDAYQPLAVPAKYAAHPEVLTAAEVGL